MLKMGSSASCSGLHRFNGSMTFGTTETNESLSGSQTHLINKLFECIGYVYVNQAFFHSRHTYLPLLRELIVEKKRPKNSPHRSRLASDRFAPTVYRELHQHFKLPLPNRRIRLSHAASLRLILFLFPPLSGINPQEGSQTKLHSVSNPYRSLNVLLLDDIAAPRTSLIRMIRLRV